MNVVIHMNATTDTVVADGTSFDRSTMTSKERGVFNRLIVEAWKKVHVPDPPRRTRQRRGKKKVRNAATAQ